MQLGGPIVTRQYLHQGLTQDRWSSMTVEEQLGNIGSEVHRAILHRKKPDLFLHTVARALELFEFTIDDPKWRVSCRLREITRVKELFCAAVLGSDEYNTTLEDLDKYFFFYACIAREDR
jgi:hypothetical protein